MDRLQVVGLGLSLVSLAAYVVALWVTYPGRSFSLTGLMVGLTLFAFGGVAGD